MDLNGAGISTFYKVKDYVSAASTIGQNNCESRVGAGVVFQTSTPADDHVTFYACRPRGHGQVLYHQRESRLTV